jgi:DNA polymerase gamma 1
VPLISPHLRSQLFPPPSSPYSPAPPTAAAIAISRAHLQSHGLLAIPSPSSKPPKPPAAAIDFVLPPLQGPTITHHFHALANSTCAPYLSLAQSFASAPITPLPTPDRWSLVAGWTFYSPDGSCESIPFPEDGEKALVFDVETLPYKGGDFPIMAVAVGELGWYGWCSPWLTGDDESPRHLIPLGPSPVESSSRGVEADSTLFEVEADSLRLIIGHNVLFDRARVESEYTLRRPSTRWLDTLSLHVAVSGLTNPQRPSYMKYRKEQNLAEAADQEVDLTEESTTRPKKSSTPPASPAVKDWKDVSSMNSLVEVARLHCGTKVDKSLRNVFIDPTTTILDVREHFQDLIAYCATDVLTTLDVYRVLLPKFLRTCPHPASFSGILLMSQPILPVDAAWPQYLDRAERTYEKSLTQVKDALKVLAEEARAKFDKTGDDGKYLWEHDLWLRQLDWSPKKARRLKGFVPDKQVKAAPTKTEEKVLDLESPPKWFVSFTEEDKSTTAALHAQVMATLLLQVTYKGFPVVFSKIHGWTFAVPSTSKSFVPDATELPIDDPMTPTGARLYSLPPRGTARVLSIMSKPMRKRIEAGILASPFGEYAIGVSSEMGSKERRGVEKKLASLAKAALDVPLVERLKDPWLAQLDWTPSRSKIVTIAPPPLSPVDPAVRDELVWPKWYHDLDVPGVGLDISIGKRTSPILLKLQWKGYPVVHSKQHGWIYRVPAEEVMTVLTANSVTALDFDEVADATLKEDDTAAYLRLPHPDGEGNNVGSPLSKPFLKAFKDGILSSTYPVAAAAIAMNASCSYWTSARERISNQMVVWEGDAKVLAPTPDPAVPSSSLPFTAGLILPQVTPMGTVTRRAVERTWLTASNAKKDRVGSELKSMVKAPPGYAIVGADVDSEELWICSVMGDAQFGVHGATAIGWMTLEGTKSAGTDLHSKSASILGISRDDAKVFNYSRIYGAGVKHAVQLLLKSNPNLSVDEATKLAKALYAGTKGLTHRGGAFERNFWHGGTESFVFNKLEEIAQSDRPRTPALGCGLTDALTKEYLPAEGRDKAGNAFMPSRINWVVQSSGVDYLHLLLVSMEYLTKRYGIDARYMISVHDEIRYLVKEEDKYRAAMALQISNIWTRTLFSYRLQMGDLPQVCSLPISPSEHY